ncbi:unnamed protein product [Lymnaea stagnalis]|uniref:Carboxylesterase type B domain-containing protein n=2 Tax=Lymnaea stagnalis TaxID=6523 RepID=A0AAV2I5K1_LYMST
MPTISFLLVVSAIFNLPQVFPFLTTSRATLDTSLGPVAGFKKQVAGVELSVFYGIPFATPPVGELRFKPPVPAQPWQDPRDVTQRPNSCWQVIDTAFNRFPGVEMWNPNTPRSEDCLYLNVWRPAGNMSSAKPIMVWIYGGGFSSGSSTLDVYDGSELTARNDVIVVSIAYRVGVMGFLYAGTSDAPGNAGLLDQALGLKWVKDNAVNLGGSPDDITIFGESAGAASVGLHLLSPVSRDLFTYAIMESASPFGPWVIQGHDLARSRTRQLATILACPTTSDYREIVECLRTKDPGALVEKQFDLVSYFFEVPIGPVVDGIFLNDTPQALISRGDVKNTSILIGVNKNEGIYFAIYGFKNYFPLDGDGTLTEGQYNAILGEIFLNNETRVEQAKGVYGSDPSSSYTDIIDAVTGDMLFKCPVVGFAQKYAELGGQVFMYSFEHRVSTNPWPEWLGTVHGYEIEVIFGLPLDPSANYTARERQLSVDMMTWWTQFAKTGNPNSASADTWPRYTTRDQIYVIIDTNDVRLGAQLRHHECAFQENHNVTHGTVERESQEETNLIEVLRSMGKRHHTVNV